MKEHFGVVGFSLLLGTIVGLSSAPTVSVLVAALVGLIGFVVGSKRHKEDDAEAKTVKLQFQHLGTFGFIALAGILLGLYIRTEDPIGPSIGDMRSEWVAAGIDEKVASALVIYQKTGLAPEGWIVSEPPGGAAVTSNALFSTTTSDKLNPEHFANLSDLEAAWKDEGEPWIGIANAINKGFDPSDRRKAYETVWILASTN